MVKHHEYPNEDVQKAAGPLQLCAGQSAGVEAAIHAMRELFAREETEGVLLVDADNAFNRINRSAALWNVQYDCPILKHILINTYRTPSHIHVQGGWDLLSEGTTQGDPLAMAMYAVALKPLLGSLKRHCKQVWFADDGTGCDSLKNLKTWWDALEKEGYFPKASKSLLILKKPQEQKTGGGSLQRL